jgi:antitoxin CptB
VDSAALAVGRLRWRCRRGMKELDKLLISYLDHHAHTADPDEIAAFEALLDEQDHDLWRWFLGRDRPSQPEWQALIAKIRAEYRA